MDDQGAMGFEEKKGGNRAHVRAGGTATRHQEEGGWITPKREPHWGSLVCAKPTFGAT